MNIVSQLWEHPAVEWLGWTLIHFLWQGAVVAGLFWITARLIRNFPAQARYTVACLFLTVLITLPVITFIALSRDTSNSPALFKTDALQALATEAESVAVAEGLSRPTVLAPELGFGNQRSFAASIRSATPWAVAAWIVGVFALSARLFCAGVRVQQLRRRRLTPLEAIWADRLADMKRQLRISRPVALFQSALVHVPTVLGWWRPVILLPASTVLGLSPDQINTILLHELAHIRRHDYLVNLLQSLIETALFYHPAVWWISRRIRVERENCCDDLVVSISGDRVEYARALTALEELRQESPQLTLASTGGGLLRRIRRILGLRAECEPMNWGQRGGLLLSAALGLLVIGLLTYPSVRAQDDPAKPAKAPPSDDISEQPTPAPLPEFDEAGFERNLKHALKNLGKQQKDLEKTLEKFGENLGASIEKLVSEALATATHQLESLNEKMGASRGTEVYDASTNKTFTVTSGGQLTVDADGEIKIESSDATEVEVLVSRKLFGKKAEKEVDGESVMQAHHVDIRQNGNRVEVRAKSDKELGPLFKQHEVTLQAVYRVRVPKKFNVTLKTVGGNISVQDLEGDVSAGSAGGKLAFGNIQGTVNGQTAGGNIALLSASGKVTVRTDGGNLKLGEMGGPTTAETSGGNIRVQTAKAKLVARTQGGNIEIADAANTLQAETSGGSISAAISAQPAEDCRLETRGGSIQVKLASDLALNVSAKTSGGRVSTDLEITDLEIKSEKGSKNDDLRGTLNGGGKSLVLRTTAGNIRIQKL